MHRYFILILCLAFGLPRAEALADRSPAASRAIHELIVSSTSATLAFSDTGSAVSIGAGYNLQVVQGLQLGLTGELLRLASGGASSTTVTMLFGPTLNLPFDDWTPDALFLTAKIGFISSGGTRLAFQSLFGKRFHLVGPLTYRPALGVQIIEGGSLTFLFQLVAFSAFF
jgi:hypothetical protein